MQTGAITGYIDVAQLCLYVFWLFFAGLVYYLHRENKREGYPLVTDRRGGVVVQGFPAMPPPKTFILHDGTTVHVPRPEVPGPMSAVPAASFPGAPLVPLGDPLLAAMGPGTYANRADVPDLTYDEQEPKIVPLRVAPAFFLALEDPDPRGYTVMGADGLVAGTVHEVWIDRSEVVVRYMEVRLTLPEAAGQTVLFPMNFADFRHKLRIARTSFLLAGQFAMVPKIKQRDSITLLEEDMILAFFGGGMLYATPARAESVL